MANFHLIRFTELSGKIVSEYGLQEVDDDGELIALYDDHADQWPSMPVATWDFVRELGYAEDHDDFWALVEGTQELNSEQDHIK